MEAELPLGMTAQDRRARDDADRAAAELTRAPKTGEGIVARAGTPDAIVARIAGDIRKVASDPGFVKSMLDVGAVIVTDTPANLPVSSSATTPNGRR